MHAAKRLFAGSRAAATGAVGAAGTGLAAPASGSLSGGDASHSAAALTPAVAPRPVVLTSPVVGGGGGVYVGVGGLLYRSPALLRKANGVRRAAASP